MYSKQKTNQGPQCLPSTWKYVMALVFLGTMRVKKQEFNRKQWRVLLKGFVINLENCHKQNLNPQIVGIRSIQKMSPYWKTFKSLSIFFLLIDKKNGLILRQKF